MIESFFLHSEKNGPKLKIGVMVDGPRLIRPFAAVLEHIETCDFADLALVIRNASPTAELVGCPMKRYLKIIGDPSRRKGLFYSKYGALDEWRNPEEAGQLAEVDCSRFLSGVTEIAIQPLGNGFVHRFAQGDVETILAHDLDVILRFGFNIIRGEALSCARYGIWSYHHGDNDFYRGGAPSFWELVEKAPLSGAILQRLTDELDDGVVLAKTLAPTKLGLSRLRNAMAPYRSAEILVISKLKQLYEQGWDAVRSSAVAPQEYKGIQNIYRTPDNRQVVGFVLKEVSDKIGRFLRRDARFLHWKVGLRPAGGQPPWIGSWQDFSWIEAPPGHFYADPFLLEDGGQTWLFVEDYDYQTERGSIACAEVLQNGEISPMRGVMTPPHHLSFPFIFEHGGQIYIIPESMGSGWIELWRAESFPYRWVADHVLLPSPGIDTVLHVADDGTHYWFTSFRQTQAAHPILFLFFSEGLRSPWQLHPASPLTMDARYSRNGGAIMRHNGMLTRTSQDLSGWYGRQMHFHRIDQLSRDHYRETLMGSRGPEWDANCLGTHTFSRSTRWEATDAIWLTPPSQKG